jgi:transcriptional regulator with XRE-family HTH domain
MAGNTPDEPQRLNAPLVRALMWGANIGTIADLAARIGVHKSQLSRAYRGESQPSIRMLTGFSAAFPAVPLGALVKAESDPQAAPEALGLRAEDLADPDGTTDDEEGGQTGP